MAVIKENIKQRIINTQKRWDKIVDFGGCFIDEWNDAKNIATVQAMWCLEDDFVVSLNKYISSVLDNRDRAELGLIALEFHRDDFINWWFEPGEYLGAKGIAFLAGKWQEESKEEAQKTTVSQSNAREKKKRPAWKEVLSWCMTLLAAFVLALVLKNYVIINATVPTGSMENTIEPGDDLFGFRLAYKFSEPERGDIVIFKFPDDESQKYVKRVIGLPGEKVTITEGKIYINNSDVPLEEDYLKEDWVRATGPFSFEVPEDSYLVLGDNRNDSYDARYWENTYVTKDEIIGKAYFTYYPFSRFGSLYQ